MTLPSHLDVFCSYCGTGIGSLARSAIYHPWCRKCDTYERSHWPAYSAFLLRTQTLEQGDFFFSLYRNPNQLRGHTMSEETARLIEVLSESEQPGYDDLIKLHGLLQAPENSAQIVATPNELSKLHRILETVAANALKPKQRKKAEPKKVKETVSWEEALRLADDEDDI